MRWVIKLPSINSSDILNTMRTKEEILKEIQEVEEELESYDWGSYASDCCKAQLWDLKRELDKEVAS